MEINKMNKIIQYKSVLLIGIILLVPPTLARANAMTYPGSLMNPLQVQIVPGLPDPLQMDEQNQRDSELRYQQQMQDIQNQALQQQQSLQQNTLLNSELKAQYGVSKYYACYSENQSYCTGNMIDPFTAGQCTKLIQSCLEKKAMFSSSAPIPTVAPAKNADQICQDNFGANSNWNGTRNDKGGYVCDCKSGYQWNAAGTSCVVTPQALQSTNDQPITPVAPVVPENLNQDTTVTFTYHANRAVPITEKDMTLISSANLRSCPNETCKPLGNYPQGTTFAVTQRYNDVFGWYGGTTPDGKEGWIYPSLLTNSVYRNENETASSSATSSQSVLSVPVHVNMQVSTSTNTLPQKGFWERVRGWFGF